MAPSNGILSAVGWYYIPGMLTDLIQKVFYGISGKPIHAGDAKYQKHRRNIYISVIICYLIYSVVDSYWSVIYEGGPFDGAYNGLYSVLGVDIHSNGQQIRSSYRRLGVQYHPDKVKTNSNEDVWLTIKSSYEVLSDPILKFGYDRFGYNVVNWKVKAKSGQSNDVALFTVYDLVYNGLWDIVYYYAFSLASIIFLSFIGFSKQGQHLKYFILFSAFLIEITIITKSKNINIFPFLNLIPFQAISIMRRLLTTFFIAINQIVPLFQPPTINSNTTEKLVNEIELYSRNIEQEVSSSLTIEYYPFPNQREKLKTKLSNHMLELEVRSDPLVSDAITQASSRL